MHTAFPSYLARTGASAVVGAALLLSGCGGKPERAAAAARPSPVVGVVTTHAQAVSQRVELPGRVEPVRVAQVRARVNGVVLKRLFSEGSMVRAGQALFQIDPAQYDAALQGARAALDRAEANLEQASAQAARYQPLAKADAVSKQDYTNVVASKKQAEADVAGARAALRMAQINSDYTSVRAPISGRIGRALVTEGALVSAQEATQLALIQQTDSVYLNITQSATELQALRRTGARTRAGAVPVRAVLDDGTEMPQPGRLLFSDLSVDPSSGQVLLRAAMPNPAGLLLPGQYVRVRLEQGSLARAILLPQQAVRRGEQGDSVLVLGPGNKVASRAVRVGGQQGASWIVLDGLAEGEQVIVDGFQKLQMMPDAPVKAVPWRGPAGASLAVAAK